MHPFSVGRAAPCVGHPFNALSLPPCPRSREWGCYICLRANTFKHSAPHGLGWRRCETAPPRVLAHGSGRQPATAQHWMSSRVGLVCCPAKQSARHPLCSDCGSLGLPSREVLYVTLREHGLLRTFAVGLPGREGLYVTLEEHIWLSALALGLPNGEVLYVTRRSTLSSGR